MKTELDAKRKFNRTELGNLNDNLSQYLQMQQDSVVLSNPSTVLSSAPATTTNQVLCQKCKLWKRVN